MCQGNTPYAAEKTSPLPEVAVIFSFWTISVQASEL